MLTKNSNEENEEIDIYKGVVDYTNCSVQKTTKIKDIDATVLELKFSDLKNLDMCYTSQILISKNKTLKELTKTAKQEIKDFINKNDDAFKEIKLIRFSNQVYKKIMDIPDKKYSNDEKEYLLFKKLDLRAGIIIVNKRKDIIKNDKYR